MLEVILFGVAAGLDNLQVGSSIGLMPMQRRRLHLLALGFCICELGGAILGLLLGRAFLAQIGPLANGLASLVMLACGVVILWLAFRNEAKALPDFVNHKAVLFLLPLSLSLDNVIAGAGISFSSAPVLTSAIVVGVISAAMACSGLYLANWLRRFMPRRIEMLSGAYLCFLAVRMMIAD
ncbi:manganese efflux pump [Undibacterium sp. CY18W]|uniref:Manganese efflux pump n=1 Tax=Undibacterium hunanense TaxID=2762292 RepID=A0ABR6ZV50_9BURK|nr:manganese efflux pump [Undibacterium hunanense]MBC3919743.1 manganese efflux pump [Undibacterium hunanense]